MVNYDKMYELLVQHGMQNKIAKLFIKKFKIEEEAYTCSEDEKKWAMSRGFFPSRVELYGLNDSNYKYYLPDYADFMMHPYNNHFAIWINDKLSLKYTLGRDFADIMPEYYLYIENNGDYTYLQDAPASIKKDENFILNLLKEKKVLIIKPNSSKSGGEGVMKVEWSSEQIRINNKEVISIQEFQDRIQNLGNNIVTEYAYQHSELKQIWPKSECTLRIIMIKLPHEDKYTESQWKCVVSFARFGTSISGGTSNLSSGGIGVGFDFQTGRFNSLGLHQVEFSNNNQSGCKEHPDTHVIWEGVVLPNWNYVKDTLYKVCKHYGSLSHLGFDVIITEKGFVLCEINSKPALNVGQVMCEPLLMAEDGRSYFMSKGYSNIDCSELYKIYNESQN